MGENILMNTCIVIGAGDFSPVEIKREAGGICIAVDGGYGYCKMLGIEPDFIVGDMDSLEEGVRGEIEEMRERNPEKLVLLDREKDDTDMLAALRIALKKGFRKFGIYGALGGRVEHTIANIQCLGFLKNNGAEACIIDGNTRITVIKNETIRFQKETEGYLSLFALGDQAEGVTIAGMKYLLDRVTVTNDYPIGISNEFIGEEGQITVENGMLLIIISRPVVSCP